uniref:RING-type domain-containing protein n=1 Tax=Mola mola TaxID=94237 RepID=A0A3Q4C087_MOLML
MSSRYVDMASVQVSPSHDSSLEKHFTCSICMEMFQNPVTTACGHTFCKECLSLRRPSPSWTIFLHLRIISFSCR